MASVAEQPEVRIGQGALRGHWESDAAVFRGIPFAEPPVGALRLVAPQPAGPWSGVRDAGSFGPPPPQAAFFGMDAENSTDDWLTVNVWSPQLGPGARRPVMVWIQGGGYVIGMSSLPEYAMRPPTRPMFSAFCHRIQMPGRHSSAPPTSATAAIHALLVHTSNANEPAGLDE